MLRATRILEALHCPFVINQNAYNILNRTIEKNGLKQAASENGKGIIAFKPLEQGLLTDRYLNGIPADSRIRTDGRFLHEDSLTDAKLSAVKKLNDMAEERGETLARMAIKWVMKDEAVTSVLIGASRQEQILDNLRALEDSPLSQEELQKIDGITKEVVY